MKFLYFEDEEGNKVQSVSIYAGSLCTGLLDDDMSIKLSIVDGKIIFELLEDFYKDDESNILKFLNTIEWDNGYEFIDFYDITNNKSYLLFADTNSNVYDSIYSEQNLDNINKIKDVLDEGKRTK